MCRRWTFLSIALFCLFFSPENTSAGQKHNFPQDECGSRCHTDPRGGELVFLTDVDTLCRDCHALADRNVHPSLIAPGMAVPSGFWLDKEGRLNCATCHDPHPEQGKESPFMLRGNARDLDFCALCHAPATPHKSVTFLAHSKAYTPSQSATSDVDRITRDCLACHDPMDPSSGVCLLGQKGQCSGHIIGLEYDEAASGNKGLKPRSGLSPFISLYEGKIGCASCHSIFSAETAMLVIGNKGSALCLGCHQK